MLPMLPMQGDKFFVIIIISLSLITPNGHFRPITNLKTNIMKNLTEKEKNVKKYQQELTKTLLYISAYADKDGFTPIDKNFVADYLDIDRTDMDFYIEQLIRQRFIKETLKICEENGDAIYKFIFPDKKEDYILRNLYTNDFLKRQARKLLILYA